MRIVTSERGRRFEKATAPLTRLLRPAMRWVRGAAAALVCLLALGIAARASAATFTVNSTADGVDANPGDGLARTAGGATTLRAAIMEANALAGPDVIVLPAGTYTLTIAGQGEDAAASGDLDVSTDITVNGAGASTTTIDGGGLDRVLDLRLSSVFALSGVTIRRGAAGSGQGGGGIQAGGSVSATLTDCTVTSNTAGLGAGIYDAGTLQLVRVRVTANSAADQGGGVYAAGSSTVVLSSIDGNLAGNIGGGFRLQGAGAVATLTNVTISGNNSANLGGGIAIASNANGITLQNVTLAGNSAVAEGGGLYRSTGALTCQLRNTLVAGNGAPTGPDASGQMTSLGNNLVSNTAGSSGWVAGDLQNVAAQIGPLADNGGATPTRALLAGSPAIDAGSATGAPVTDQRGVARPQDAGYDIGAYEAQAPSIGGRVFEDVNYGGGAGRSLASSSGVARTGARVELFDGAGAFVSATVTDGTGSYSFTALAAGTYLVRVVSGSVTSSRTGYVAGLLPVLTYRTDASSGTATGVTDFVGGLDPATPDAGNAAAGWTLNASTGVFSGTGSGKAHAFAPVNLGASGVGGVDFGWCFGVVVNRNAVGQGSLAGAVANANSLGGDAALAQAGRPPGIENLVFMLGNGTSGAGLRAAVDQFAGGIATIQPGASLTLSTPMVVDAQTQPGWSGSPILELDGTGTGSTVSGFTMSGNGSTVRGFIINRWGDYGISVTGSGSTIQGNWVGLANTGAAAAANGTAGIAVNGANTMVGGTLPAQRNVVSGNSLGLRRGVHVFNGCNGSVVTGNYLGTNAAGTAALPGQSNGVMLSAATDVVVGGTAPGAGNLVSGNSSAGAYVTGGSTGVRFQGNRFGTDASGTGTIPNPWAIYVEGGATVDTIGGVAAGAANVVTGSTVGGIAIDRQGGAASAIAILGNRVYGNAGLGIDLGANGVTVNDGGTSGTQPNVSMDYPVFTGATLLGTQLAVAGYVGSAPGQSSFAGARVEVFASDDDPSGHGEGRTFVGALTTDANGNFAGTLDASGTGLAAGNAITGTATDAAGNTSEFGTNFVVVTPGLAGTVFEDVGYGGGAGRSLAASGGAPRPGARVELYDGAGAFVSFTTTDALGSYAFGGLATGSYIVRVVNASVTSSRPGALAGLLAVPTYRTDAATGPPVAVTDRVGGEDPSKSDAGDGATTLAALTTTTTTAQSVTAVALGPSGVSGVDFGFCFDAIVNVNDSGQGSLRQWIANANTLGNSGLAQAGRPAGIESAIWMISNGTSAPGLRAANDYFTAGVATFSPGAPLPAVADPVVLDATTQPGFAGTPIVEINGAGAGAGADGLDLTAGGSTVQGLVINRFAGHGLHLRANGGNTIRGNFVGLDAAGAAALGNGGDGVLLDGVSNNTVGGTGAGAGNRIGGNSLAGVAVDLAAGTAAGNAILGNAILANGGIGIDLGANGVTANDGAKSAGQPNLLMDFPLVTTAVLSGTSLTVSGYVGSAPGQTAFAGARVELFKANPDPLGYGEGETYLGFLTADPNGGFAGVLPAGVLAVGDRVTATATDGSGNTSEFGANVAVSSPAITVSPTAGLVTTEAGGTATFTVVLDGPPTADVTLALGSSDPTEGTVAPVSLTFTAADWSVPQTVTVTGVDDVIQDGTVAYSIVTAPAASTDPAYNGIDPADVAASNTDDDVGQVATFTASPSVLLADGVATSVLTVTLRTTSGAPIPGKTVAFASDRGGSDAIQQPAGPTDANGVATGSIASTIAGIATLTATNVTDSLTVATRPQVTFTRGAVLQLELAAARRVVHLGQPVPYTLAVRNRGASDVTGFRIVATPPRAFRYLPGSARWNGRPIPDPPAGLVAAFAVDSLAGFVDANGDGIAGPGESGYAELSYTLIPGAGAEPGTYDASAVASDACPSCAISNVATAQVRVEESDLLSQGTILGQVFEDRNRNGRQDRDEPGIGTAQVVLDDGSRVTADSQGRFHVPAVTPGDRVLKFDLASLATPGLLTTDPALVVSVRPGLLARAEFGVWCGRDTVRIGRPAVPGLAMVMDSIQNDLELVGDIHRPALLVNGHPVHLRTCDARVTADGLDEIVRLDGDRPKEPVQFRIEAVDAPEVARYALLVFDAAGDTVRRFTGAGAPPARLSWDGALADGEGIRAGQLYPYQLRVEFADGGVASSARRVLGVERRAAASPAGSRGPRSEARGARLRDYYRGSPSVTVAGVEAAVGDDGRFGLRIPQPPDRSVDIRLTDLQGRVVTTRVAVPRLEILSPRGETRVPYSGQVGDFRAGPGAVLERGSAGDLASLDPVVTEGVVGAFRLRGRTDPGGRVEVDGRSVVLAPDGTFGADVALRPGENTFGVMARDAAGAVNVTNVTVRVLQSEPDGRAIEAERAVPVLSVFLPPREMPLRGNRLTVSGATAPGNRVTVNGDSATVGPDGAFTTTVTLPEGRSALTVGVRDPWGAAGSVERDVEVRSQGLFAVAVAEGMVGSRGSSGFLRTTPATSGRTWDEARLAYYVHGTVAGRYRLTSGFDTGRRTFASLFKDTDSSAEDRLQRQLDRDRLYPAYGDSSTIAYETEPAGRFHMALEGDALQARVGSFPISLQQTELAGFQRTLYGAQVSYQTPDRGGEPGGTQVTVLGAEARFTPVHDVLDATGGSLYYLSQSDVVEGSEQVTLVIRDRITGLPLWRLPQTRGSDYDVKYVEGRLFFSRPVPSVWDDGTLVNGTPLRGHTVTIEVDFETRRDRLSNGAAGGRIHQRVGSRLGLGTTYLEDRTGVQSYRLGGADAELRLGAHSRIVGEVARSEGSQARTFSSGNGGVGFVASDTLGDGDQGAAWKAAAELDPGEWFGAPGRAHVGGYLKRVEPGFHATGSAGPAGRDLLGWNGGVDLRGWGRWSARFDRETRTDSVSGLGGAVHGSDRLSLGWQRDAERWGAAAEYQGASLSRVDSATARSDVGAFRLWRRLWPGWTTTLERQQGSGGDDLTSLGLRVGLPGGLEFDGAGSQGRDGHALRAALGANVGGRRFYARDEWAERSDGPVRGTVLGVEAPLGPMARAYSEYQWRQGPGQDGVRSLLGLEQGWRPASGTTLRMSGEWSTSELPGGTTKHGTLASELAYAGRLPVTGATRAEWRVDGVEGRDHQVLSATRLESRPVRGFSLRGDYRHSTTRRADGAAGLRYEETGVGLVYRPPAGGRVHGLGRYTWLDDRRPSGPADSLARGTLLGVAALEATVLLRPGLEWSGKYARSVLRDGTGSGFVPSSHTDLWISRIHVALLSPVGIASEYRVLRQSEAANARAGWLEELTWALGPRVRLGGGYNFTRITDDEFAQGRENDHGWFVRAQARY